MFRYRRSGIDGRDNMSVRVLCFLAMTCIALTGPAAAQSRYDDAGTAAGWAWQKIRSDQVADFADRVPPGSSTTCGDLDATKEDESDTCHTVSATFIADALTVPSMRMQIGRHGLRIRNARIQGTIDLADADISSEVWLDASRIEGSVNLDDSHWQHLLSLEGTTIAGDFHGWRLTLLSTLLLRNGAAVQGSVNFGGARITGDLDLSASAFKDLSANSAKIESNLFLNQARFSGRVTLQGAAVDNAVNADGATFADQLDLNAAQIKGALFLRDKGNFLGDVNLIGVRVGGTVEAMGSSFAKKFEADRITSGGTVFLDHAQFGDDVDLNGADIGSDLYTGASWFNGRVALQSAKVRSDALLNDGATFGNTLDLSGAQVVGLLALDTSTATDILLLRTEIGELGLRDLGWRCPDAQPPANTDANAGNPAPPPPPPAHWNLADPAWPAARCGAGPGPKFVLRNAHVGAFQDSDDAWPPVIDLEGFRYDRIGGIGGDAMMGGDETDDMRKRSTAKWIDWLARDPVFSTQPYAQLSAVLAAAGYRDKGEEIQYAGRERERHQAEGWGAWGWLTFLWLVSGYGLGLHTFYAGLWVLGFTFLGALMLRISPQARSHGWWWRIGASLHRLLPVIELSKEFTNFFDDLPKQRILPRRLGRFLQAYFAAHALAGYVLGFFLIAAMSGLTQK